MLKIVGFNNRETVAFPYRSNFASSEAIVTSLLLRKDIKSPLFLASLLIRVNSQIKSLDARDTESTMS